MITYMDDEFQELDMPMNSIKNCKGLQLIIFSYQTN